MVGPCENLLAISLPLSIVMQNGVIFILTSQADTVGLHEVMLTLLLQKLIWKQGLRCSIFIWEWSWEAQAREWENL